MSSKAFIFLGLLFVVAVLLFSSEEVTVTARDVKSIEGAMMEMGGVDDVKRRGFGGGRLRFGGGGHHGHDSCHHGCCHHHHGSCSRCCSFAGEAVDAQLQAKPNN